MDDRQTVPARRTLETAARVNRENGHENLGFLSESHGFAPVALPVQQLPDQYHAWDALAAELPDLYRTLALRKAIDALDPLSADAAIELGSEALLATARRLPQAFENFLRRVRSELPRPAATRRTEGEVSRRRSP